MNFFVTGLPRSRTSWLANFLTTSDTFCYHEALNGCRSIEDFESLLTGPYRAIGDSDCALPLLDIDLNGPLVIIERNKEEVIDSLEDIFGEHPNLIKMVDLLDNKLKSMDGLRVKFEDINDRLKDIWRHCIGYGFDQRRADMLMNLRIEPHEIDANQQSFDFLMR